ncbi:melanocortin receptor 5-like [Branchiostoma lanceolatum]|uniref:melanocortin receptor 5-like n=1 Tax=Branchiostoma lanceolatum TaxID=7740 RepID=UPI003456DA0C
MMMFRQLNIQTALALVLLANSSFGTTLTSQGLDLNLTAEVGNNTYSVDGSETWENLSKNCSSLGTTNTSQVEGNITSTQEGCFEDNIEIPESVPVWTRIRYLWVFHIFNGLAIWSIVGNSLPLAAIIKYEALHNKPVYILMANLAASDILTGLSLLITMSTTFFHAKAGIPFATDLVQLLFAFLFLSALSSAYSLLALTAERYWFIVRGMTYEYKITNERCKIVVIAVWMWSIILALLPTFGWSCTYPSHVGCVQLGGGSQPGYLVLFLILIYIPMALIVIFNIRVFRCLWQQVSDIRQQEAAVQAQPSTSRKSAITILILTIVFLVGWLPYCTVIANEVACTEDCGNVDPAVTAFVTLNSAVNPIIYGFRLREIRRSVKHLFVCRAVNTWNP